MKFGWSAIIVALVCSPSMAVTLSWPDCVREALAENPDIAVAMANVKNAQALEFGAYSGFFPQISASVTAGENSVNGAAPISSGSAGVNTTGAFGTAQTAYSESLQLNQSLFNGFSDAGRVAQAKANVQVAKANLAIVKATVSSNLKSAFAQLLYDQKAVELSQQILKRQNDNLRMVTLRYESGNENRGNQLYQAAAVSQAQYQYDHAVRQVRAGARQLATLMGHPQYAEIIVVGDLNTKTPPRDPDMERVIRENPSHIQAIYQLTAAQEQVTINTGNWYPNLNLVGSVGKSASTWPPQVERWSVGLALTFPFFPGTSTIASVQSAHALEREAESTIVSVDMKLLATLEAAFAGLLDAIGQVKVADDYYKGAHARSIIADGKYNNGLMAFEDWSVIDTDYTTRQQNLLSNQLNALQAEASWEQAEGIGDIK